MKDEIVYDDGYWYIDGCIKAYVRGKKSLSWILAIIRGTDAKIINHIVDSLDLDVDIKKEVLREFKI